jgi:hypothetical protein
LISIFVKNILVVNLIVVPIRLVVNLVYRFWGHGHMKATTFWDKGGR